MHELSVARGMMDAALENAAANNAERILRITVVVGRMTGVSPDSLRFAFDALKPGTPAEGAELDIEESPAVAHCAACGTSFEAGQYDFVCRECGAPVRPRGGEELYVRELEVE